MLEAGQILENKVDRPNFDDIYMPLRKTGTQKCTCTNYTSVKKEKHLA